MIVSPETEGIVTVYLHMIASGVCPECASIEGRSPRYRKVVVRDHAHIALPCKHVLWRDFGYHRPGAVIMS
jgi:hypothetical protein